MLWKLYESFWVCPLIKTVYIDDFTYYKVTPQNKCCLPMMNWEGPCTASIPYTLLLYQIFDITLDNLKSVFFFFK